MPRATLYCVKDKEHWRIGQAHCWGNVLVAKRHLHCLALWLAEKQSLSDETLCLPVKQNPTGIAGLIETSSRGDKLLGVGPEPAAMQ